jgi:16S rRNA (guanine527-N7)-methyltransferase
VAAEVRRRLDDLQGRYSLAPGASAAFARLLELVAAEPASITAVRDPAEGVDAHVADSLIALELPAVRQAEQAADMGSGGGFPGLALAIALPGTRMTLVESVSRKASFLADAVEELGLSNVGVVRARVEEWRAGEGRHELVTARALAPLPVLLEYAAPLLVAEGSLVAWKGEVDGSEEADAAAAAAILGMTQPTATRAAPFADARSRYLYVSSKVKPTPLRFPRRAGMARKRPLRAST